MIGVFINPGPHARAAGADAAGVGRSHDQSARPNTTRSTTSTRASIVDELMPVLYKDYNISKDPERPRHRRRELRRDRRRSPSPGSGPNEFRKVLSIVGSFVNLRGGDAYADIVRKSEKKPIRDLPAGRPQRQSRRRRGAARTTRRRDWFFQNVRLMQALTEKGYDVNYTWGIGRHGQKQGGAILPGDDALALARPRRVDRPERRRRAVVQRARR